jgi:endo-1,4-beta-xylanase
MTRNGFLALISTTSAAALSFGGCAGGTQGSMLLPSIDDGTGSSAAGLQRAALNAALSRPGTLAYYAARSGRLFGSFVDWPAKLDAPYLHLVTRECSLMNPWGLSPNTTRQSPTGFDFSYADSLIALARANNLAVCGGYLSDHDSQPSWITAQTPRPAALAELQLIVKTTMSRYAGQLSYWIVGNEAIAIDSGNPYSMRDCIWRSAIGGDVAAGTDYVSEAFRAARRADPSATLVYADYGIEDGDSASTQKRAAVLALLTSLRRAGLVDALGVQGHLTASSSTFSAAAFRGFLDSAYALGLTVVITEMDVNDKAAPSDYKSRDSIVAAKSAALLQVALSHPGVTSITVWGISDNHSWLNDAALTQFARADGLPQRSTLLDSNLARKPAYASTRSALQAASAT